MTIPVLYLIDALNTGGTERQMLLLAENLDPKRIQPHIGVLQSHNIGGRLDTKLPRLVLNFRTFGHPSLVICLFRLARYIRRHRIQLVQTFFQDAALLGALSKPLHGARLVGSFRDLGFWRTPGQNRKMRLAYRFYNGFIANSQAVKQHFAIKDALPPEKITVIHNGIDLSHIEPFSKPADAQHHPVIGIVANLNRPVKRVQDFIHAAAIVHRRYPKARFVIIGEGHLRPVLERLAETDAVATATTFTGLVDEPLREIHQWSIGVITSESEGLCNALIEYMALGIPVVATHAGGNPELVTHGHNGLLYPVGDIDALARCIMTLLENDVLRDDMARHNAGAIATGFAVEHLVRRHDDYYRNLLHHG